MQIVVQHHQNFIGRNIAAAAVDDAQAIAIAVQGDAQIVAAVHHLFGQLAQAVLAGRGGDAAEVGVALGVDDIHCAAHGMQNNHQRVGARAVHGVKQDAQPAITDGLTIDAGQDIIQKIVKGIFDILDAAVGLAHGERHKARIQRRAVGQRLDALRGFHRRVAAFLHNQLDAVVDGRVMAGCYLQGAVQVLLEHRVHQQGRGRAAVQKKHLKTLRAKYLRQPFGRFAGEKTPVVTDNDRPVRAAVFL